MVIYGVMLLSACYLIGVVAGDALGALLGVQANVGGVGIAMLILILVAGALKERDVALLKLEPITESGITFWSAMYIPIVIAMAAKQNVVAALSSGWLAIIAGVLAVVVSFAMIPVLARLARGSGAEHVTGDGNADD